MHEVVAEGDVDASEEDAYGQDEGRKCQKHRAAQLQQLCGTGYQALQQHQQQRQQEKQN
jgi:hypothetical protein